MKKLILIFSIMLLFLNMTAQVQLGNVLLKNINSFEIDENINEVSNTAKITIPRNYSKLNGKAILEQFKVGDKVTIESGYDGDYAREFTGYIRQIESDIPLVIHCDDETYPLRQTSYIKSYKDATLKQILTDIMPDNISIECPDIRIGKYEIDKKSAFTVMSEIMHDYGMYSSLYDNKLEIHLQNLKGYGNTHIYTINAPEDKLCQANVKKNNLKFKRKEDFKLKVKLTAVQSNGKRITAEYPETLKDDETSIFSINYPGNHTKSELQEIARNMYNVRCYDGYTGDIIGFGLPRTHAGDSLELRDSLEPERAGTYRIEKVNISYGDSSGFSRKNTLSYRLDSGIKNT